MIKNFKKENGITLIALVVTIIVLIILAGVSISLVLGDNGIITKAKEAKQNTELAKVEEETEMNELLIEFDTIVNDYVPYNNPYIPKDFTYVEGTWNSGYTIKDGLGNQFIWVPCVTDASKIKEGDNVEIFKKTLEGRYNNKPLDLSVTNENIIDAEPTEAIRKSVEKYGGFYIAKYEAGVPVDENGDEITSNLNISLKARSVAGATPWVNIKRGDAIITAQNMINNNPEIKTGLISSECWDTTLQWIVNASDNASENSGFDIDSTGKGWYEKENKTKTGQYKINNIYDIGGNVSEWVTENCIYQAENREVNRGGHYGYPGKSTPAADRGSQQIDTKGDVIGFRVVLYKNI